MQRAILSFFAGGLFGAGLLISQMTNPMKIISFLDILGNWDPSLIFVMLGALLVTFFGYRIVLGKDSPLFSDRFHIPDAKNLDRRLIGGAALFGIGWGLSGLCPGPAIALTTYGGEKVLYFLAGLVVSIALFRLLSGRNA